MFGLEKKPRNFFEFDLEKEIKKDPKKAKEICDQLDKKISGLKEELRKGAQGEDFEHLGTLLHGYVAMQKVIGRIQKAK